MMHDPDRRFLLGGLAGAAGVSALAAMSKAGPLNPPSGPVGPTGRTLDEVEPRIAVNGTNTPGDIDGVYRISQPGSYYLTGNITGAANKHGIKITASNVTLDLCGFTVQGVPQSLDGISTTAANLSGIRVLNGIVRGWGASGVTLYSGASACLISGIHAIGNNATGINAHTSTAVTGCVASSNATGIAVSTACHVVGCVCSNNTGDGITADTRNLVSGNSCHGNAGAGIHLFGASLGGNRVEGNDCSGGARGYYVQNALNILVRNTALTHSVAAWTVSSLNFLQVLSPASPAAFSGATGGIALAPAGYDPNANFTLG